MDKKQYRIKFRCPNPDCDSTMVEEVMVHVSQFSPITDIDVLQDGCVVSEYQNCSYEGGEVLQYTCADCEYSLRTEPTDFPITTNEELFEWLKEHDMLEERDDENRDTTR